MPVAKPSSPDQENEVSLGTTEASEHVSVETQEDRRDVSSGGLVDLSRGRGEAFRALYERWVEQGGELKGKTHHSLRRIKLWLGEQNEVKSLEPKLAGRTKLQRRDTKNLLILFLDRWIYDSNIEKHHPYEGDAKSIIETTLAQLFPPGETTLELPDRTHPGDTETKFEEESPRNIDDRTELARANTRKQFKESMAYITVSRQKSVLGDDPSSTLALFRTLLSELHDIDDQDDEERALVWAVDLGTRENTEGGRQTLFNMIALSNLFEAIALMSTSRRATELWEWLLKRVIILVSSLEQEWIDKCYDKAGVDLPVARQDLPFFVADRVTLNGVPNDWLESETQKISSAFGIPSTSVWSQPTILISIERDSTGDDQKAENARYQDSKISFHYHGLRKQNLVVDKLLGEPQPRARSIPLKRLGLRWLDIFGLATTAAFGRLGWEKSVGVVTDPDEALVHCRNQGMAVLKLDEFLDLKREIRLSLLSTEPD